MENAETREKPKTYHRQRDVRIYTGVIDACEAVTYDTVRITGVDGDVDEERVRTHRFLEHNYALSMYGSIAASNHSQLHEMPQNEMMQQN